MNDNPRAGRGYWEGKTPPVTAGPEKNLGGEETIRRTDATPKILVKNVGSSIYSWTVAVQLGLERVVYPDTDDPRHGSVIGLIEWGQGAASFSAEVDMRQGGAVTVVATSIKVSAFIDRSDGENDDALIVSAVAKAALVWGGRPAFSPVTRTHRRVVAAGASVIVPIPEFAANVSIVSGNPGVMDGSVGPVTVEFLDGPAPTDRVVLAIANTGGVFIQTAIATGILPPGSARFARITNGAGVPVDISLVWRLYL